MYKAASDGSFDDLRRVLDSMVKIDERPWLDLRSGLNRRTIQKGICTMGLWTVLQ
ncbi:hypothetical protein [Flagellimonas aurea]|uniref:hypothetical protein n=1 Tax=Flagellimonas aurea TaxID=2915619 RepID=UPI0035D0E1F8